MLEWARQHLQQVRGHLDSLPYLGPLIARVTHIERTVLVAVLRGPAARFAFAKIANEVGQGETRAFDEWLLVSLRTPGDPAVPIGPKRVQELMRDITALGSTGVLTIMVLSVVGFLAMTR